MERFDVFVIGGGGTGSEVAFSLAEQNDLRIGIAERDKLGGECNHYGCVPTKAMLASARAAAGARNAGRYGVRVGSVEVDFPAVVRRGPAGLPSTPRQRAQTLPGNQSAWVFLTD